MNSAMSIGALRIFALLALFVSCGALEAAPKQADPADLRVDVDVTRHWSKHHFAMTNWFYKYKWNQPEEHIRILAEAGYQGAMLSLKDDPKRWKMLPAYLKALQEHGMKLTAIHCRFHIEDGTYPQVIKDNLPLLNDSGVILIPSVASRNKMDRRDPKAVALAVGILREMSDDATKHKLGGVAPYMHINNWLETVDDGMFIAEQVKRKNVGVMFHLHHWTTVAQREHKKKSKTPFVADQAKLAADLAKAKPYLMVMVIQGQDHNNATHKIVGEGSFDMAPLVRTLTKIGFNGPLGTMGYTQSGDIPGKLKRANLSWEDIKKKAKLPAGAAIKIPAPASQKAPVQLTGKKVPPAKLGIGIRAITASASQDGYPPIGAVDANASTRWSAYGPEQWLKIELRKPVELNSIGIGFHKGKRRYRFGVELSSDGKTWSKPALFTSSGSGDGVETYKLKRTTARYVRLLAKGSNSNDWNNIHTVYIAGVNTLPMANSPTRSAPTVSSSKLKATEFAKTKMVGSVVGISVDNQSNVYVTQTNRRGIPTNDIRKVAGIVEETLSAKTMEDKRRLVTAKIKNWESLKQRKEMIIKLSDSDGDGQADVKNILHEGFNTEVHGLAGGVLYHEGSLYVACIPGFYKLTDRDKDGKIDDSEVEELVYGLGINIGYGGHDMHGPTLGPDGRIYWSIGDKGFSVKDKQGKRHYYPGHGGVFRIEPDGSGFEVFAHGLRNPQELAFDEYGNLFTVDNDADIGDKERVHFVVEGTDSGWRAHHQVLSNNRWKHLNGYNPWMAEKLWQPKHEGQAAYLTPSIANYSTGPIGFTYNPGTALSPDYYRTFFLAESNKQTVAFKLTPDGAGFTMSQPEKVLSGTFAIGINFGPDGALYMANWGNNGWAPHNNGSVVKLDDPAAAENPLRKETRALLAADPSKLPLEKLGMMLAHADQRVRLVGQLECVKRGDSGLEVLHAFAKENENPLARIHALWGVGQIGRKDNKVMSELMPLFDDDDPEILCQLAKVMGEARYQPCAGKLNQLITHKNPRVQMFAALAASKLESDRFFDATITMLTDNADKDPFVRHAGVMSLFSIAQRDKNKVLGLYRNPSVAVRLAAVVALRRLQYPAISIFLNDADSLVQLEAARAIHDDLSIPQALPGLAAMLNQSDSSNEAIIRRCISANRRLAGKENVQALVAYARNAKAPVAMREHALDILAKWDKPLVMDKIQAFHRGLPAANVDDLATQLKLLMDLLNDDPLKQSMIRLLVELDDKQCLTKIEAIALNEKEPIATREEALRAMVALGSAKMESSVASFMKSGNAKIRQTALSALSKAKPDSDMAWNFASTVDHTASLENQRYALGLLGKMKNKRAEAVLIKWMDQMMVKAVKPEVQLDLYDALRSSQLPAVKTKLAKLDKRINTYPYGKFQMALAGGDVKNGKVIFHRGATAQCQRCHEPLKKGQNVGPDLKGIGSKHDAEYLLRAMIKPSADITAENRHFQIELNDGEVAFGRIVSETKNDLVLSIAAGETRTIKLADIKKRSEQKISAMPDFTHMLSVNDVRDLVAYLESLEK